MSGSDFKITEASDYRDKYQTSRKDLKENAAAEWKEADKGDVEVSEGETKTNVDIAHDASVSESKNYELVDDAAHARQASQNGYEYSKGVGGSHITEDYKHWSSDWLIWFCGGGGGGIRKFFFFTFEKNWCKTSLKVSASNENV